MTLAHGVPLPIEDPEAAPLPLDEDPPVVDAPLPDEGEPLADEPSAPGMRLDEEPLPVAGMLDDESDDEPLVDGELLDAPPDVELLDGMELDAPPCDELLDGMELDAPPCDESLDDGELPGDEPLVDGVEDWPAPDELLPDELPLIPEPVLGVLTPWFDDGELPDGLPAAWPASPQPPSAARVARVKQTVMVRMVMGMSF